MMRKVVALALLMIAAAMIVVIVPSCAGKGAPPKPVEEQPAPQPIPIPEGPLGMKVTLLGKPEQITEEPQKIFTEPKKLDILISPDTKRVATSDGSSVLVDGKTTKMLAVKIDSMAFSDDSKHFLYAGTAVGSRCVVVLNGVETAAKGLVLKAVISPDGRKFAYVYDENGKQVPVVDGAAGKGYVAVTWLGFSSDSKRCAYVAKSGEKKVVVVDGKESREYDDVATGPAMHPMFGADSKHFGYVAKADGKSYVVLDGEEQADRFGLVFSPDGKRVALLATNPQTKKSFIIVDGAPSNELGGVGCPVFSPDSKHFAYAAGEAVVLDEKATLAGGAVKSITFSPDSQRVAYATSAGKLFVDGKEVLSDMVKETPVVSLAFSPDSKRYACFTYLLSKSSMGNHMVIDGKVGKQYWRVGPAVDCLNSYKAAPVFSPDSAHVVYTTFSPQETLIVVDTTEYSLNITPLSMPVFDSPRKFHFIGLKFNEIYLVEMEIPE